MRQPLTAGSAGPGHCAIGTDDVAPTNQVALMRVNHRWDRMRARLTPDASRSIHCDNYERPPDEARAKVRA